MVECQQAFRTRDRDRVTIKGLSQTEIAWDHRRIREGRTSDSLGPFLLLLLRFEFRRPLGNERESEDQIRRKQEASTPGRAHRERGKGFLFGLDERETRRELK